MSLLRSVDGTALGTGDINHDEFRTAEHPHYSSIRPRLYVTTIERRLTLSPHDCTPYSRAASLRAVFVTICLFP
jgi:hypothetical protein